MLLWTKERRAMCNVASYGYNSLFKMFYHPRLWHEIVSVAFVCVSVCCVCEPLTFEGLGSETSFLIGLRIYIFVMSRSRSSI